ncbi:hypothetical protein BCR37DRAFT_360988, partial [Protomyces lactucae-debilis]
NCITPPYTPRQTRPALLCLGTKPFFLGARAVRGRRNCILRDRQASPCTARRLFAYLLLASSGSAAPSTLLRQVRLPLK